MYIYKGCVCENKLKAWKVGAHQKYTSNGIDRQEETSRLSTIYAPVPPSHFTLGSPRLPSKRRKKRKRPLFSTTSPISYSQVLVITSFLSGHAPPLHSPKIRKLTLHSVTGSHTWAAAGDVPATTATCRWCSCCRLSGSAQRQYTVASSSRHVSHYFEGLLNVNYFSEYISVIAGWILSSSKF